MSQLRRKWEDFNKMMRKAAREYRGWGPVEDYLKDCEEDESKLQIIRYRDPKSNFTVLLTAMEAAPAHIIRKLIECGADVNAAATVSTAVNLSCLIGACECSREWEVFDLLISSGVEVDRIRYAADDQVTPLFLAVQNRVEPKAIHCLLRAGADPNFRRIMKRGPFDSVVFRAAQSNVDPETMRLLLEYGGDPNSLSAMGASPLGVAQESGGSTELTQVLIEYGSDVNHVFIPKNETPLIVAFKYARHNIEILRHPPPQKHQPGGALLKPKSHQCSFCYEFKDHTLGECVKCMTVRYCDSACQKGHWKNHRIFCKRIQHSTTSANV
jgi:ankyrin repeat protein